VVAFIKSTLQPAFPVTMADLPDRLRRQRQHTRNPRRTDSFGQLQKGQGSQYDPHLLNRHSAVSAIASCFCL
jgi:hypothetical protein